MATTITDGVNIKHRTVLFSFDRLQYAQTDTAIDQKLDGEKACGNEASCFYTHSFPVMAHLSKRTFTVISCRTTVFFFACIQVNFMAFTR